MVTELIFLENNAEQSYIELANILLFYIHPWRCFLNIHSFIHLMTIFSAWYSIGLRNGCWGFCDQFSLSGFFRKSKAQRSKWTHKGIWCHHSQNWGWQTLSECSPQLAAWFNVYLYGFLRFFWEISLPFVNFLNSGSVFIFLHKVTICSEKYPLILCKVYMLA